MTLPKEETANIFIKRDGGLVKKTIYIKHYFEYDGQLFMTHRGEGALSKFWVVSHYKTGLAVVKNEKTIKAIEEKFFLFYEKVKDQFQEVVNRALSEIGIANESSEEASK